MLLWEAPWESIQALHRIVGMPAFANKVLNFIREPQH